MGINFADEKVNVKSIPQFGSTRKILNPVEEEIKRSGLKIPKPEYERMSVENYMTKEEYKAFSSLPPSQQKRAFEVFKQSPEYKRFKKKLDAQSELLSKNVTDSVTFFDEKNKKNEQPYTDNQNYSYRINEQEASYSAMENTKKAGEQTAKKAAENGAKTAAQTGAAAGSGGASEIAKEATEAVKKYADTLKDASSQPESDPTDYQTEHSSDIAISKSGMGTIQKITAVIMAFAAALISQLGVILLPLLIVLAVVTDTYMDNDKLAAQIKEANDLAVKVTQANIEIRDLFQNQVKAAYDKEKETQKKLMEQYQLTLDEKERAYKLMMTQRDEARTKIKMLEAQISDMEDKLNIGSANLDQDSSRKTINTGFFSKLFSKKKDENAAYVYDSFVKEIASDKRYSAEQKDFLMRCMEDGFVYEEIRRIARPELDVAMMERLANYYKKKVK